MTVCPWVVSIENDKRLQETVEEYRTDVLCEIVRMQNNLTGYVEYMIYNILSHILVIKCKVKFVLRSAKK